MNFFKVTLKDGKITDDGNNFTLTVPGGCLKVLKDKGYDGKEIVFGIRPEDIHSEPAFLETFPESVVNAEVVVSELLGADSQLYSRVGNTEFVSKVDARQDRRFKWALTSTRRTSSTKTRNCPYIKIRPLVFQRGFGMLRSLFLCIL